MTCLRDVQEDLSEGYFIRRPPLTMGYMMEMENRAFDD